ncbi:MAG: hypothetical protein U0572_02575 [Phycisphaerales bacterium]
MLIATTHLSPVVAVGVGGAILVAAAWYWNALGSPGVPRRRRMLRRTSLVIAVVGVAAAVSGFSIVDPDVRPVPYAITWAVGAVAILLSISAAIVDALLSVRLHVDEARTLRRRKSEEMTRLVEEAAQRRREGGT